MNQRIKELADQLGPIATIGNWGRVEWADNVYPQLGDKMYAAIDLQKFAELLVQECADVACKHMELNEGVDYNVGEKIKQHFGVEE
jgi:hypothetical protein